MRRLPTFRTSNFCISKCHIEGLNLKLFRISEFRSQNSVSEWLLASLKRQSSARLFRRQLKAQSMSFLAEIGDDSLLILLFIGITSQGFCLSQAHSNDTARPKKEGQNITVELLPIKSRINKRKRCRTGNHCSIQLLNHYRLHLPIPPSPHCAP